MAKRGKDKERLRRATAIGELLPLAAKRTVGRRGFLDTRLLARWEEIVGERIGAVTRPSRLSPPKRGQKIGEAKGRTLTLRVASAQAVLIQHAAPQILERVNAVLGPGTVARLRLESGPLYRPASRSPVPATPSSDRAPPLDGIEDPALAAALGRLAMRVRGPR